MNWAWTRALSSMLVTKQSLVELLTQLGVGSESISDNERFDLIEAVRVHEDLAAVGGADALSAARLLAASGDINDLPAIANLAKRAHDDGIAPAGVVFAEAMDKMSLYRGRPQPYGTVMIEHQGDVVQPPVDPTVTDAERAEFGIAPRDQLRAQCIEMSRTLAIERAANPTPLGPGQRYCRVWTDPQPADLRARMEREGQAAWADGDVLTMVCESEAPVAATPVFPMASWDAGDGLQVLSLRVERLAEAVITYTFTPLTGGGALRTERGSHDGRFRGETAPRELPSNDPLVGSLTTQTIESLACGGERLVSVYLPAGHVRGEDIPVVYATDGNMFSPYARRLDAAIEAGDCPRVVVVAAHAAAMDQINGNQRALEYLRGFDEGRFSAHQRFFGVELMAWAETEIGVPRSPAMRGILGCSDGGGHALTTAVLTPRSYAHVFAYSTGTPPDPAMMAQGLWDVAAGPFVHLCAGTLEDGFYQATEAWAGYLAAMGARYEFTERVAGHDLIQWCEELPLAIARSWG